MKKRITLLTAGILCAVSIVVGAAASTVIKEIKAELRPDFTVKIDGEVQEFKTAQGDIVYPILYEGTTYLPIRAIGEIMGKAVYWNEDKKLIELKSTTVTDADVIIGGADAPTSIEISSSDKKPNNNENANSNNANGNVDKSKFISQGQAKELALKKAALSSNNVNFIKVELDFDDGIWKYEVEFEKDRVEYDVDINALDGSILKFERDFND